MPSCPICQASVEEEAAVCANCGWDFSFEFGLALDNGAIAPQSQMLAFKKYKEYVEWSQGIWAQKEKLEHENQELELENKILREGDRRSRENEVSLLQTFFRSTEEWARQDWIENQRLKEENRRLQGEIQTELQQSNAAIARDTRIDRLVRQYNDGSHDFSTQLTPVSVKMASLADVDVFLEENRRGEYGVHRETLTLFPTRKLEITDYNLESIQDIFVLRNLPKNILNSCDRFEVIEPAKVCQESQRVWKLQRTGVLQFFERKKHKI